MNQLTENEIVEFSKLIDAQATKEEVSRHTQEIVEEKDKLLSVLKTDNVDSPNFIDEKLNEYTLEELKSLFNKNPDAVNDFFIDPVSGNELELTVPFESDQKKQDFKKDFLLYIKTTNDALEGISKQEQELSEYVTEMNKDIKEAATSLSDNILGYIQILKDKADALPIGKARSDMNKMIYHIESGFTLGAFRDVLVKYPSVPKRCVDEVTKQDVARVGQRYLEKLNKNNVPASLIMFISNDTDTLSFEEKMLIKDDQYKVPNLFIYSLIRFFSMADWNDPNTRRLHSSTMIMIKRLVRNELADEVKELQIERIVNYLTLFPTT